MKLWNEISYDVQVKVMNLIEELLLKQKTEDMQDGMAAALGELEVWSNSPCQVVEPKEEEQYVAQASAPEPGDYEA